MLLSLTLLNRVQAAYVHPERESFVRIAVAPDLLP